MKTATEIRNRVEGFPSGIPFTTNEFSSAGPRASVDQALSRLVRSGQITRLARGVFAKLKVNRYVGAVTPEPMKIAEAVARSTGASVQVHGAEAARRFGLSTQVPMRPIFYTSGNSRKLRVGKLPIELRRASPRKLVLAGRPAGVALSALWYLGKEHVTSSVLEQVHSKLGPREFEVLIGAMSAMPAWMAEAVRKYNNSETRRA